jgi:hypothetical protein
LEEFDPKFNTEKALVVDFRFRFSGIDGTGGAETKSPWSKRPQDFMSFVVPVALSAEDWDPERERVVVVVGVVVVAAVVAVGLVSVVVLLVIELGRSAADELNEEEEEDWLSQGW